MLAGFVCTAYVFLFPILWLDGRHPHFFSLNIILVAGVPSVVAAFVILIILQLLGRCCW